jgi:peptide subunit release factor 1 (eRF1)
MFSTSMLKKEIKTASNIKNRQNRNNVESCLKQAIETLTKIGKEERKNGIILCCGITKYNEDICEVIFPTIPNNISYYRCDNKFHTWMIESYLKKEEKNILLVLIYGDYCGIYACSNENIKKIYDQSTLLVKRHGRGGSSSGRFSRIADESRIHYVSIISDKINQILVEKNLPIVIDGGRELVEDLRQSLTKKNMKPVILNYFHQYQQGILDKNKNIIRKAIKDIYENNEAEVKQFLSDFYQYPDLFCVSTEEIKTNLEQLSTILILEDSKQNYILEKFTNKIIYVSISSKLYGEIKTLGGIIGRKFF